ncbi:PspC domain-containing protein [Dyadobacter sp. LJ53]|uniref:PspC domain-containing protein n=1 Tax=Dyadobacter chenwenxiniae TaxID=2906456 RepID=UPI001F2F6059|nr:PspC domain-containing protein [Dyadobacter chenwenxiniae]MCF0050073.1 PspC domain-containing protein [Dyadobacter chenwenxiniae]
MEKKLHRIPDQAVFGGVASGIAQYFQIDVVIVRVLFVVMLLLPIPPTFGMTAFIYIILWAVLPTGPVETIYTTNTSFDANPLRPSDPVSDKKKSDQTVMILGAVLIFFGAVMLVDDFPVWYQFKKYFWPIVLIAIGAFLILRQRDKEHQNNTTVYPTTPPPPVDPIAPEPEPQPYTPFTPSTTTTSTTHFPEDPEAKKPDGEDDQVIKVN